MKNEISIVENISYSALSDWQYCPYYYKLVNIDKLKPFVKSVWIYWGSLIHKYVQGVLAEKIEPEQASKRFIRTWKKFCSICKEEEYAELYEVGSKTILSIRDSFKKQFGDYKILKIEEKLLQPISSAKNNYPQKFKGFIDISFELLDKNNKIIIADFKSCFSSFKFKKHKDKYKDYQLTLYKHFYQIKYNKNKEEVETFFIPLERNPRSKKPISFVRVSSGPKKVQNALEWMQRALSAINRGCWVKNRMSCLKYGKDYPCDFYNSSHCPGNKIK